MRNRAGATAYPPLSAPRLGRRVGGRDEPERDRLAKAARIPEGEILGVPDLFLALE